MAQVTHHAILRYQERIAPVSELEAHSAIMAAAKAIDAAADFGCTMVRMANGARLRLKGDVVCTVTVAPWKEH